MKKYIESIDVENFKEVNLKINNWKNEIINEVKIKTNHTKKWLSICSGILSVLFFIWGTVNISDTEKNMKMILTI